MKNLVVVSILASMVALTGCNTIKGLGKDVTKVGEKVTNTATKTQNKM